MAGRWPSFCCLLGPVEPSASGSPKARQVNGTKGPAIPYCPHLLQLITVMRILTGTDVSPASLSNSKSSHGILLSFTLGAPLPLAESHPDALTAFAAGMGDQAVDAASDGIKEEEAAEPVSKRIKIEEDASFSGAAEAAGRLSAGVTESAVELQEGAGGQESTAALRRLLERHGEMGKLLRSPGESRCPPFPASVPLSLSFSAGPPSFLHLILCPSPPPPHCHSVPPLSPCPTPRHFRNRAVSHQCFSRSSRRLPGGLSLRHPSLSPPRWSRGPAGAPLPMVSPKRLPGPPDVGPPPRFRRAGQQAG